MGADKFENDVKTYSIQTRVSATAHMRSFENDVKTYSIQTFLQNTLTQSRLRMM